MRKRTFRLELNTVLLFLTSVAIAQCPVISVNVPDSVCINESFNIANTSSGTLGFEWDFCTNDLDSGLEATSLGINASLSLPLGMTMEEDNGEWFGFIASEGTDIIYRLDFGSDVESTPVYVDLGNIGGLMDEPQAIRVIEEAGSWYGLVANAGSGQVVRIAFGANLNNNSPSAAVAFNAGANNSGLSVLEEGNQTVVFVTDLNDLIRADFGNSITNNPTSGDIDTLDLFTGAITLNGIDFIRDCENWYAVLSDITSRQLFYTSFGNSLLNMPTVSVIDHGLSLGNPTQLIFTRDFESFFLFLMTRDGTTFRADFGSDLANPVFNFTDLGELGLLGANMQALAHASDSSNHHFFTINFTTRELFRLDAQNNCLSNTPFSGDFAPTGVSYSQAGAYHVQSIATDTDGLQSYHLDSVVVLPDPLAMFTSDLQCTGQSTEFFDNTTTFGRTIAMWAWDFGDPGSGGNNTSTLQNPTHDFATAGDYIISLTVTNVCGRMDNVMSLVTIYDTNDLQANFTFDMPSCSNDSIQFTDLSTFTTDTPVSWLWDFDDPTSSENTSTQQNPKHLFASAGMYDVQLDVTGISGCVKTIIIQLDVAAGPTAAFSAPSTCQNEALQFTNSSLNAVSYLWDFGDGFTSNAENPSHLYASSGNFTVMLTATDINGCEHTTMQEVAISAVPIVSFDFDVPCTSEGGIQFTDLTTVSGGSIFSRSWLVDGVEVSTDQNPVIVFQSEGTVNVELVTVSSGGCQDSYNEDILVLSSPQPDFSMNLGCLGEASTFDDLTSSPGNPVVSWLWTVDGVMYNTQNISHVFSGAGMFDVTLEVTGQNFCSETITQTVEIFQLPTVSFGVSGDCSNEIVTLTDQSTEFQDPIVSREWFLDAASVGNGNQLFLESLPEATYDLILEVTTQLGCVVNTSQQLVINTSPQSSFSSTSTFGIPGDEVTFTDASSGASSVEWLLNGAAFSSELTPQTLLFSESGTHEVSLVANNDLGCSDTTTTEILIAIPDVDLSIGQFDLVDNGGTGTIFLEIQNNSNLPIEVTEAVIELENQFSVTEQILALVEIGGSELVSLDVGIPLAVSELSYLCVNLNSQYVDYPDRTPVDNEKCITIQPNVVVEPPFPNPVSGETRIKVIVPEAGSASITLLDASGRMKLSQNEQLIQGLNSLFIDLQTLNTGIYFVKVEMQGTTAIHRVIKL